MAVPNSETVKQVGLHLRDFDCTPLRWLLAHSS